MKVIKPCPVNSLTNQSKIAYNDKLLWTKYFGKWWSAYIEKKVFKGRISVFIYGINLTLERKRSECLDFVEGFQEVVKQQKDEMGERWTKGVVEALKELYQNDPDCINYDLKTLAKTGLVKFSKRKNEDETPLPLKKRYSSSLNIDGSENFECGRLVWAKYGEHWWSGIIIEKFPDGTTDKKYVVFWMSDHTISEISNKKVIDFVLNFMNVVSSSSNRKSKLWKKGVVDTLHELYNYEIKFEDKDLKKIALEGLPNVPEQKNSVPIWIQNILKNNDNNDESLESSEKKTPCPLTIKELISGKLKSKEFLEGVCLGCYTASGAEIEHPLFKGHVCSKCLARIKRTMIVKGDDGFHYFCAVCGIPGLIVLCDNDNCGRAYCFQCISDLTAKNTWDILLSTEKWLCFLCENSSTARVIYGRDDYSVRIHQLYTPEKLQLVRPPSKPLPTDKKLRVLSLFDGISTGYHCLQKLNIPIEAYYSSEIDVAAINISKLNFGDSITQIGDVTNITERTIKEISPIHLLIGGSPCNDLSLANPGRKGLFGIVQLLVN